ncbi:MAG: hypothetical protein NUV91_04545 [Candidatus Omnitrophica bacterium]|nr:hypothetical protein [Candidatus Omnitrophota bacterium]
MKKITAIILFSLFLTTAAQANCGKCGVGDKHPEANKDQMVSEKVAKMTAEFNLTDEQKAQVQNLIQEKMTKKEAIMEEKHKAMQALHEDFHAKLKGVLTEEQIKKWESMKEECPECEKEGKMCKVCAAKKGKGHDHEHDHDDKE